MSHLSRVLAVLRRPTPALVGAGVAFGFGIALIPQTLALSWYQRQLEKEDCKLDNNTSQLIADVTTRHFADSVQDNRIQYFMTYESEPVHRGSTTLKTGAIVGIPAVYVAQTIDDLDRLQLKLKGNAFPWRSEEGEALAATLNLSAAGKQFMIAREVMYAHTSHVYWAALLKVFMAGVAYCVGRAVNIYLNLQQVLKTWARLQLYGLIATCASIVYVVMFDAYNCVRDRQVDRRVAALGQEYVRGGVEYYSKLLKRNIILRSMMGASGEKLFTKFGNDKTLVRRRHMEISARLDCMKHYGKSLYELDTVADSKLS